VPAPAQPHGSLAASIPTVSIPIARNECSMGLIWLGIVLIVLGVLLSFTGLFPVGGALANIGWLLLLVGIVLAVLHFVVGPRTRYV
jgi:hypothetical protein